MRVERLVLASVSPRRRQLLHQLGLAFTIVPAHIDETARPEERPDALVRRLAVTKAVTVASFQRDALVIGSDTVVALGREIFGKPKDAPDAVALLKRLSGVRHQIYTGVAVWSSVRQRGYVRISIAHVTFRALLASEIEEYVATGEPMDKAGAYAIQGGAGKWVESYEGNLETVIGLPTDEVKALIERITGGPWDVFRDA